MRYAPPSVPLASVPLTPLLLTSLVAVLSGPAGAELVVTELMYDPASTEPAWEWLEVFNPTADDIDLRGHFFDRVGDPALGANPTPHVRPVVSVNGAAVLNATVIPAGSVAVLYNGDALGYDRQRFRRAWPQIPTGVPLVGVSGWGGNPLANSPAPPDVAPTLPGLTFGVWPSEAAYRSDTADVGDPGDPDQRVTGVDAASMSFSYLVGGEWPTSDGGPSIVYSGIGDRSRGGSWGPAAVGAAQAYQSTATFLAGEPINGRDRGSPGAVPSGGMPTPRPVGPSVLISEIMANPASTDGSREWEWIEIVNYGAATIDFAATPMWFDDDDGGEINAANLSEGAIAPGGVAVLFDPLAASVAEMQAAWDANAGLNLIPVSPWPNLANGGDTIGIWDDAVLYAIDKIDDTAANALVAVDYDDSAPWPTDNGTDSIYLRRLTFPQNHGPAWTRSGDDGSGDPNAYVATPVLDPVGVPDNSGQDIGSPGLYAGAAAPLAGDYNDDGLVNLADYTRWRDELAIRGRLPNETASPGIIDEADYDAWSTAMLGSQTATPAPEPAAAALLAVAAAIRGRLRWSRPGAL